MRRPRTNISRPWFFFTVILSLVLGWCGDTLWGDSLAWGKPLRIINIGIVHDGPYSNDGMGVTFKRGVIQREIINLTKGEFTVRFPKRFRRHGNWTKGGVRQALQSLLRNSEVDLILSLGVIATHEALQQRIFSKPVIAPFVIDAAMQGAPIQNGRSSVRNLNFLTSFKSFERDLKTFMEIVPFSHLALLEDEVVPKAIPQIIKKIAQAARENHITIYPIPIGHTVDNLRDRIPEDVEAVFVVPLFRLNPGEFDRLVTILIERRLPSFSLVGRTEVERGLFASVAPETDYFRLARRVALNVHRILLGEHPEDLPVTFSEGEQLTINMATARAINVWPSFRVLTEADLLNEEEPEISRKVSLYHVVREAARVNLDLAAADRKVSGGLGDVLNARSSLLPQINIGTSARIIDQDRAIGGFGNNPEKAAFAQGTLSQLIFSDRALSNYTVEQRNQESRVAERRQVELDVIQEAAVGFLNILRTKTIERIQKENLKLTRLNLDLARMRESIGAGARDEVYRWESEIANGRIEVLNAQAQRQQSEVALNRTLHRPLEEPFQTVEASLDDPLLFHGIERIFAYVNNPRNFQAFRDFQAVEGLQLSPEIQQFDARIAAQQRIALNARRNYWAPELSLETDVNQRIGQAGLGQGSGIGNIPAQDRTTWNLGVGLTFPLFTGGGKDATHLKAVESLRQLRLEREATVGRIEERIRAANFQAGASSAAIRLSREASAAAQKNLELVRDQYARGVVDIIKLLNSQNAALTAKLNAANSVFNFLIDIFNIHRATGSFTYFESPSALEEWHQRLEKFFALRGIDITKELVRSPFQ